MSSMGLVETVCWSAVACAVWLATLSSVTVPELGIALAASIPCGLLARASRRALGGSWRFRARWCLWLLPVTASLFAELVALFRLSAMRPHQGALRTIDLPDEAAETAAGREALGILALSSTPGSVVADCDREHGRVTVHVLVSAGPDVEKVFRR